MTTNQPRPRYALVTGCTPGGIGHALALTLSSSPYSYHVLATVRDPSKPELVSLAHRSNITLLALDVTSPASIAALVDRVKTLTSSRLHLLINNAGRNYTVPALEADMNEVQSVFETNVFSVIALTNALAPLLLAAAAASPPSVAAAAAPPIIVSALKAFARLVSFGLVGHLSAPRPSAPMIINIGSIAATLPYVFGSVYNASKAALHAYGDTLRLELSPFGVDVVTIVTGGVKSNIGRVERFLAADSRYAAAEKEYRHRQIYAAEVGMRSEEYAGRVCRRVLGPAGERHFVWEGAMVGLARSAGWVPRWVVDWWMGTKFGLDKVADDVRKKS